jgi:hypothetical protein
MLQLVYISTTRVDVGITECRAILQKAQANTAKLSITGLLLFNSKRFLQVLEGPDKYVDQLFKHIATDPRHRAIVELGRKTIADREFGGWAMAYDDGSSHGSADLASSVTALLNRTTDSTRALFESAAQLHRKCTS